MVPLRLEVVGAFRDTGNECVRPTFTISPGILGRFSVLFRHAAMKFGWQLTGACRKLPALTARRAWRSTFPSVVGGQPLILRAPSTWLLAGFRIGSRAGSQ